MQCIKHVVNILNTLTALTQLGHKGVMQQKIIKSYKEQLVQIATDTGWALKDACIDAGIADSTYYRWNSHSTNPRLKEAETVARYMFTYPCN